MIRLCISVHDKEFHNQIDITYDEKSVYIDTMPAKIDFSWGALDGVIEALTVIKDIKEKGIKNERDFMDGTGVIYGSHVEITE